MEICPVNTFVCLVKPHAPLDQSNSQQITLNPSDKELKLILDDPEQERSWDVSYNNSPENKDAFIAETKQLTDLVLKGYNVSTLSMSQGERKSTHYERQKDLQTTIGLLKEAVKKSKMSVRYEFAYVGLDDAFTFDFLEGKERPNEEIIESGLESLMKEANDLNCVWDATKGGSKIPYVLSIKITDLNTLKQGRFQLIDLIIPPFSFRSLKTGETLYQSLHDLVSLVKTLSEPYRGHLPSDANVLTNILSHGICGHEKLNVFLYLNDRIMHQKCQDTVALLDFAATLKHIPVHTLPSISVFQAKEYKRLAREAHELSTSFESELIRKNKEVDFLIGLRKVREKQIAYLEAAHDELRNGPNLELDKLQYALDLQKNEYKDLLFQHRLLEVECERYMESEKPRLEDALKVSHLKINTLQQEISQSEHTLQESDQRVKQLEQALEESDQKCRQLQQALDRSSSRSRELEQLSEESKKRLEQLEKDKNEPSEGPQHLQQALDESDRQCKQLAAQIQRLEEQNERDLEERVKIATKELEKDIQARLKKEYDSKKDRKYQVLFTDYKSKLESIKKSYKDKIEMMKQHHQNDMELIREVEQANQAKETEQLRLDLEGFKEKSIELTKTVRELKVSLKKRKTAQD